MADRAPQGRPWDERTGAPPTVLARERGRARVRAVTAMTGAAGLVTAGVVALTLPGSASSKQPAGTQASRSPVQSPAGQSGAGQSAAGSRSGNAVVSGDDGSGDDGGTRHRSRSRSRQQSRPAPAPTPTASPVTSHATSGGS